MKIVIIIEGGCVSGIIATGICEIHIIDKDMTKVGEPCHHQNDIGIDDIFSDSDADRIIDNAKGKDEELEK